MSLVQATNAHPLCIKDSYSSLSNSQNILHYGSVSSRIYYKQRVTKTAFEKPLKFNRIDIEVSGQRVSNGYA